MVETNDIKGNNSINDYKGVIIGHILNTHTHTHAQRPLLKNL